MNDPKYSTMRKLIIAIGIIAAILAFLISFRVKGQLTVIGRTLKVNSVIARIALEDRIQYVYEVGNFSGFVVRRERGARKFEPEYRADCFVME